MMFKPVYFSLFYSILYIVLWLGLPVSTVQAEAVPVSPPPAKKIKTKKKKKHTRYHLFQKQSFKKSNKKPSNIVFGLYLTFAILILLPVFVLAGTLLVALGFPSLLAYILGCSLLGIGNLGVILAGFFTGATKNYNTQVLYFAVWVLFGLNLAALITFALLYSFVFTGATLLLSLSIAVGIIALIFLIWAAIITRAKRKFKQKSYLDEQ